jgi:hypothetical protein
MVLPGCSSLTSLQPDARSSLTSLRIIIPEALDEQASRKWGSYPEESCTVESKQFEIAKILL